MSFKNFDFINEILNFTFRSLCLFYGFCFLFFSDTYTFNFFPDSIVNLPQHFKIFVDTSPFSGATDTPCFRLLVTSAMGYKARMESLLLCFLTCAQWIPQIHPFCDTCWLYSCQHGSRGFSSHVLVDISTSTGGARTHDRACRNIITSYFLFLTEANDLLVNSFVLKASVFWIIDIWFSRFLTRHFYCLVKF